MKKFLEKVWKFINSRIFGYIVVILLIVFFIGTCNRVNNLKDELKRKDQNISALTDSITTVKLKNGDLQVSINGYIATEKELRQYNSELADAVKAQKGKVITLNQIVFNLKQDTSELRKYIRELEKPEPPKPENDSTWRVFWNLNYVYDSTNYDIFRGMTRIRLNGPVLLQNVSVSHLNTELTYRDSQIGLTWGQKWEGTGKNKRLKVYAETAHPAFSAKLLQGTYVDYPTKRHWFTGFGVGPQIGVGYNPITNGAVIYGGIGIHYNVYQW
jgi:hypothetical protein